LFFLQPQHKQQKIYKKNVNLIHLKYNSTNSFTKLFNSIYIINKLCQKLRKTNVDLVWIGITSNPKDIFSFIYSFFFKKDKILVQLFTPSVNKNKTIRNLLDYLISINLKFYNHICIAGAYKKMCERYRLNISNVAKVDLGMYDYGFFERGFDSLRLLYLGNLTGREIHKTIEGFAKFKKNNPEIVCSFDIIGKGDIKSTQLIKNIIYDHNLKSEVIMHGYKADKDIPTFLNKCNIGVSYVPMTDFYNDVKVTKTIEYLLTGMPVIATKNTYNLAVVNDDNGVLCSDNSQSFCDALNTLYLKTSYYNPNLIRKNVLHKSLKSSIKNDYVKLIDSILF